ncbi:hypothetical protein E2C01_096625 [Portunus trituberculatus]|uniref:Uncharacterized protein n=1 Tax=Portunus trituberculatus TaxID=210409 RepID=A0A5B7JT15_PORTR|nr:hypothetical protein [Portunus trituberculatus]
MIRDLAQRRRFRPYLKIWKREESLKAQQLHGCPQYF